MPDEDMGRTVDQAGTGGDEAEIDELAPESDEAEAQEAMRRLQEEIGRLSIADHIVLMMHSLSALAADRLGLSPDSVEHRDLEQARLAIDAFRALLGTLEGARPAEEMRAHRAALSQLQIAYVSALGAGDTSGTAGTS
jgi:hypothetical protein